MMVIDSCDDGSGDGVGSDDGVGNDDDDGSGECWQDHYKGW